MKLVDSNYYWAGPITNGVIYKITYLHKRKYSVHIKKEIKKQTGHRWQVAIIWCTMMGSAIMGSMGKSEQKFKWGLMTHACMHRPRRKRCNGKLDNCTTTGRVGSALLMCKVIMEHYARPLWVNKNWIAIHEPLIKADLKWVAMRIRAGMRSIWQYLILWIS